MNDWNSHRIRPAMGAVCPSGIPDDLYEMPHLQGIILVFKNMGVTNDCLFLSVENCLKEADHDIYNTFMGRAEEPRQFYPEEFEDWALSVLDDLGITRNNITSQNCWSIYSALVQYISLFFAQ